MPQNPYRTGFISHARAVYEVLRDAPVINDFYSVEQILEKIKKRYPNNKTMQTLSREQVIRAASMLARRGVLDRKRSNATDSAHAIINTYKMLDARAVKIVEGSSRRDLRYVTPYERNRSPVKVHKHGVGTNSLILERLVDVMEPNKLYVGKTLTAMVNEKFGLNHPPPSILSALESAIGEYALPATKNWLVQKGIKIECYTRAELSEVTISKIENHKKHSRFYKMVPLTDAPVIEKDFDGNPFPKPATTPVIESTPAPVATQNTDKRDKTPLTEKLVFAIELLHEIHRELIDQQSTTNKLKELKKLLDNSNLD